MTLVDVREDWEIQSPRCPPPHLHIPMGRIAERLGELEPPRADGRDLPLRRPQPRRWRDSSNRSGFAVGVQPGRRHPGVVPGHRPQDPAVLSARSD